MPKLTGKTAVITGGSGGIGGAIALALAEQNVNVVITYHSDAEAATTVIDKVQRLGVKAKALKINLLHPEDRELLVKESYEFLGDVDILINCAGVLTAKPFLELSSEEIRKVLEINLFAPFFIMQNFGKRMRENQLNLLNQNKNLNDYCIINITSINRKIISPGFAHYEMSKAGLSQATKSAAMDLARYKIRVNEVAPGFVLTKIHGKQNLTLWEKRARIPLNRPGKPEEIAQVVISIAENPWMTGVTIAPDGGRRLNFYGSENKKSEDEGSNANLSLAKL